MTTATHTQTAETTQSASVNQISVTGRLGQDCEVRYFENCKKTSISIAVDESGKEPGWYAVTLWNLSEKQDAALMRGTKVTVTGQMRCERWNDRTTGEPRRKFVLHVNDKMALELHSRSRLRKTPALAPAAQPAPAPAPAPAISDEDWDCISF